MVSQEMCGEVQHNMTGYRKYVRKDGKPADPIKQKQGRSSKARGAAFERRIVKLYRKWGWHVQHNTKGIYDLVCTPPYITPFDLPPYLLGEKTTHFLQPTLAKYLPRDKKQGLIENNLRWMGRAFVVQRKDEYPFELIFTSVHDLKIR